MPDLPDLTRKFVFEQADVRGEFVRLDSSLTAILDIHQYAPSVSTLIGELLTASVLLSTTIKFQGRLILQAESEGEIPLLMAECSNELQVRAIARGAEHATSTEFSSLLRNGRLAITIEPEAGQRYQGIVPLSGTNLASCIEHYFETSEQLPTRLWLASDGNRASGLLLQQLPAQIQTAAEDRAEYWQHLQVLADTVATDELLQLEHEQLLTRLFHEDPLTLFPAQTPDFACSCSRQRCQTALGAISPDELLEIFEEQDEISMDCEFCNQQYLFTAADLSAELERVIPPPVH